MRFFRRPAQMAFEILARQDFEDAALARRAEG
jgi:hypothetical protein